MRRGLLSSFSLPRTGTRRYVPKKPNVYDKEIDGNALHYGQKFYLIANPGLLGDSSASEEPPLATSSC